MSIAYTTSMNNIIEVHTMGVARTKTVASTLKKNMYLTIAISGEVKNNETDKQKSGVVGNTRSIRR